MDGTRPIGIHHPQKRRLVLLGDLVNKGPDSVRVLRLLAGLKRSGAGLSLIGNHDALLLDALRDPGAKHRKSVRRTARAVRAHGWLFVSRVISLLESMPTQATIAMPADHPMAGDGHLTFVHAACPIRHIGRADASARHRNVFGFSEKEEAGRAKRKRGWTRRYSGRRWIVHGHTPKHGLKRTRRTLCLDTGAGQGGNLSLLRLVSGEVMVQPVFLAPCASDHVLQLSA